MYLDTTGRIIWCAQTQNHQRRTESAFLEKGNTQPVNLDTIVRRRDADFHCKKSATVHLQTFARSPGRATGDNQRRTLLQNSLLFWRTLINEVEEVENIFFFFHRTSYEPMSYCKVLYRSTGIFSRKNSIHDSSFQIKSSI